MNNVKSLRPVTGLSALVLSLSAVQVAAEQAPQAYSDFGTQPGYTQPGYVQPMPQDYAAQQGYMPQMPQGYADPGYYYPQAPAYQAAPGYYPADPGYYAQPMVDPYSYGYSGYPGYAAPAMPNMPQGMPGNWNTLPFAGGDNPLFDGDNPFNNPFDEHGYWADPHFQPWRSGPFERDRWTDNHPMSNMPWGNFPGWGDGFFGGFGPDEWQGVTPWGNNVPFKWIDPTDPRDSIGDIWDDALNTPSKFGRMPPGWTAPYISVPNPVEVEEEFERNARKFPDEMQNMIDTGNGDFGNGFSRETDKDGKPKPFIEPIKPVGPIYGEKPGQQQPGK